MKVAIDSTKCSAYGTCADHCPSVFELDEWGYAGVKNDGEVPPGDEEQARVAVNDCPEAAITIIAE